MKQETLKDYEKAVNKVVDYINANLYDSPDLKTLAGVVNVSEYHLHRIFKIVIGENIGEFMARLRLEDIAQRLRTTSKTLTDIAFQTGYGTKHSLSKAFKNHFGMSPSAYRAQPQDQSYFSRGDKRDKLTLLPDIRKIDAKRVVYIRIMDWYGAADSYAKAWGKLINFARDNDLINEHTEYIGLSFDDPTITKPDNCRFYACITINKEIKPSGVFGVRAIEGGLYAVFKLRGSYKGLLNLYDNIYTNWIPGSDYRLRNKISFEKYINSSYQDTRNEAQTEIYVPIRARK